MKSYSAIKNVALLLCMLTVGFFSSCSSDDDNQPTGATNEEMAKRIRESLYDEEGYVLANKLSTYETGEYNLIAEKEEDVRDFFTKLTDMEAPAKSEYEYICKSSDGKCTVTIKGTQTAKDGIFATIYFSVPGCPELKMIHIGTDAIMGNNNSEDALPGTSDGYTHRIKGVK